MKLALKVGVGFVLGYLLGTMAIKMYQDGHAEAFGQTKAYYAVALPPYPGTVNPDITQENLARTICNPKWHTSAIRPPSSYTTALKKQQLKDMGLSYKTSEVELDHVVSLEIGGNPTDPKNLWPEPYVLNVNGELLGARQKDSVENYLHKLVCSGTLTLKDAQKMIGTDWVAVYHRMHGKVPNEDSVDKSDE